MSFMTLKYTRGRTLAEVMIAMAIGLVISLAVTSLFISNSQTYRIFDDKSLMEEDGRMALNMLAYHVRMVGYGNIKNTGNQTESGGGATDYNTIVWGEPIAGCTGGFVSATASPAVCTNSGTAPDSFIVHYIVDSDNANQGSASAVSPTDCLGQAIAINPADSTYTIENRYYIALNATTNRNELYCVGNGGVAFGTSSWLAGQPVMENVVDMKVIYGYDQQGTQSANSFFSAASLVAGTVPAPAGQLPGDPPLSKWARVVSAKICLVMRSANDNLAPTSTKYTDCSGNVVTPTDKRLYSTFSTVVTLRGRAAGNSL